MTNQPQPPTEIDLAFVDLFEQYAARSRIIAGISLGNAIAIGFIAGMRQALAHPEWAAGFMAQTSAPDFAGQEFRDGLVDLLPIERHDGK